MLTPKTMVTALAALVTLHAPGAAKAEERWDLASKEADTLYTEKKDTEALAAYRALTADKEAPAGLRARAQSRVGYILHRQGNRASARLEWRRVLTDYPSEAAYASDALMRLAGLATLDQDWPGAIFYFGRFTREYGGSPVFRETAAEAQLRIGFCHMRARTGGKRANLSAVHAFEAVVSQYPDQSKWAADARIQLIGLKMEQAMDGTVTWADAQKAAESFLDEYPNDIPRAARACQMLAEILAYQDKPLEALGPLARIQSSYQAAEPALLGTTQFSLGLYYDRIGAYRQALEAYRTFLRDFPESLLPGSERPLAQYSIGCLLHILRRDSEALDALAKFKTDYPTSPLLSDVDQKIAQIKAEAPL